jgi:hypothetical protein
MAVVDARLCAHGLTGLRVANASIMPTGATKKNWSGSEPSPRRFVPLALTAPGSISTSMSDLQSQMHAAMAEALRARQKKRDAAEALRARQHEYETASLRGRQQQINRARVALEAAEAAYEAAKRDLQRLNDKAEEVVQAQIRAAYM